MKTLLIVLAALTMWGPPRLRITPRPLGTALEQPLDLDALAVFQVATWVAAGSVVALSIASRGITARRLIPKIVWTSSLKFYMLYGLLALASAVYSVSPVYTLFFAAKVITSVLIVALLTDRGDLTSRWPLVLRIYLITNIAACLLNVSLLAVDPKLVGSEESNIGYRLAGGILEDYGTPAAMAGLYFLASALFYSQGPARLLQWTLYAATWVPLAFSRTRSSIIGAATMLAIMLLLLRSVRARILVSVSVGIAALVLVGTQALDVILAFGLRGQNIELLTTLTGRTNAFEFLLSQWRESPWLGRGYGAGSRYVLVDFVRESGLGIGSAHDAVSKALVDLGLVGAALLLVILVLSWNEVIGLVRAARGCPALKPLAAQLFALLAFSTLTNVVAAGIAEASYIFLIVAVCARVLRSRITGHAFQTGKAEAQPHILTHA